MIEVNGWVKCLNCGQRYYREKYTKRTNSCCPACQSKEYEPDDDASDDDESINDYIDKDY
jgi:Zn finger protein HypA/HybF involved in hydrogenase expression